MKMVIVLLTVLMVLPCDIDLLSLPVHAFRLEVFRNLSYI